MGALRALSRFEQAFKRVLAGQTHSLPGLGGDEFVAIVEDLIWALLQKVAHDGTRAAHLLEVEHFRVPPGWRAPLTLGTISRIDIRFRQAVLAIIASLLLPTYFAELTIASCYLGRPDTYSRLLRALRPEHAEELIARAQRWPLFYRLQVRQATRTQSTLWR
jgi:hypothetical protein